jgi:trk system potassium uptake protein TrkA
MMKRKQTVLVAGLGRFGTALCEQLSAISQYVVAVDTDRERVASVSDYVDIAAQVDVTDEDALVKVGAKEVDVGVVAIGESLEASILATTILKGLGVPLVIARAQSALHARILSRVGAQKVIFPERDIGKRVAEQIVHPWISSFSQISGSSFFIGEVAPLAEMVGKTLSELHFRKTYNVMVLLFARDGKFLFPTADTVIGGGDRLLISGERDDIDALVERIRQESGREGSEDRP